MSSLRLRTRVFLALTWLLLGLLLGFGVFSYWSLQRGLGPYVAQIELGRLEYLEGQLRREYATQQDWSTLTPERWQQLVTAGRSRGTASTPAEPRRATIGPSQSEQPRPIERHPIQERLGLLDKNGTLIAGVAMAPGSAVNPLLDAEHRLIGTLLLRPPPYLRTQIDSAFLREHLVFLFAAGVLGLLVAMGLTWWLSRRWMQPIDALSAGARSFAAGQLDHRIPVRGSDELAQLTRQYNHMAEQLQHAQAQQADWLSQVAHELRTPLAAMRAEIEALQDGIRSFDAQTANRLHGQTMRLTALVSDLRASLGQAQPASMALEQDRHASTAIDMRALVLESIDAMRARYEQRGIALPSPSELQRGIAPGTVHGSPEQLHQVFANILENSSRYTDAGGRVEWHSRQVPGHFGTRAAWEICIDDTAPGVTGEQLPQLFERFFRADASRSRASGGSGLGLAICRSIVQAHGGEILAMHSPLGGLRICIRLPLISTPP
ncbi:ATP-binding protein [Comamonas humi]